MKNRIPNFNGIVKELERLYGFKFEKLPEPEVQGV